MSPVSSILRALHAQRARDREGFRTGLMEDTAMVVAMVVDVGGVSSWVENGLTR